jgi:membrane associated rhomboid family serine protease
MGIQDRDYYREGPSFLDRVGQQGATVWLVAITCGVFVGQIFSHGALTDLGAYNPKLILDGQLWRLFTPIFLHAGPFHLIFNMFALFWAAQRLEAVYGPRELVAFYLTAGVFANLAYFCAYLANLAAFSTAVGASGAVVAVLILFALHFPRQQLLFFFFIPMPALAAVLLFVVLDLYGAMGGQMKGFGANVAYLVHLGGACFGLLYFESGVRLSGVFVRPRAAAVRPQLRVVPPVTELDPAARSGEAPDEQLEAKLDAVLEKVSKHGQSSLTPEEREILFRASEVFKKRRK